MPAEAKHKEKKPFLARLGLESGIKRRWFLNSISMVLLVLLLLALVAAMGVTYYYYSAMESLLATRADTQAKYMNRYFSSSYSEFYEYGRNMVQSFGLADRVEMQMLDDRGRVMFSSNGLTAGFTPQTEEISQAFSTGRIAPYVGYDTLTEEKVMAVTAPLFYKSGRIIGAVRYVTSLQQLDRQLVQVYLIAAGVFAVIAALVIFSNSFFLRSIVTPVLKINEFAKKITGGQYGIQIDT